MQRERKIKVVVADDSSIVLAMTVRYFRQNEQFQVVGEAENGLEALELLARLQPDLLVMDYQMPRLNGLEALREIRRRSLPVKVILTSSEDFAQIWEGTGADAFFPKGEALSKLSELAAGLLPDGDPGGPQAFAIQKERPEGLILI